MADETIQGTSPIITSPTELSADALRPASADDIMSAIGAASSPTARTAATTRRRGRPPGSRNKTAAEKLAETNPEAAKAAEEAAKREVKKRRAEELEQAVYGELNDQLMTMAMTMFNISPDMLYLPGKGPVIKLKDQRFTELGNALAIPPGLAKSIGKLASELEDTGAGKAVSGVTQNSNIGLIVSGGMAMFGVFQYARQLNDTFEKLKPFLEAKKAYENSKNVENTEQEPTQDIGGPQ